MTSIMTRVSARITLTPTRSVRSKRENYALKPTGNPKDFFEVPPKRDGAKSRSPFTHGKFVPLTSVLWFLKLDHSQHPWQ
ncbi:hypothetical protein M758_8G088000 [Ceratodon purpureus]|nr:hypothetical protein M758_8G088000 [Ceratodon purpureus]